MSDSSAMMVWFLLLVCFITISHAADNSTITCPENCTCANTEEIECANISDMPTFSDRSFIKTLWIRFNRNTPSLTKTDFSGFTALRRLDLRGSFISSLNNDTFDLIKNTVELIDLKDTELTELPSGLFVEFPNLKQLNIDVNKLSAIEIDSFVNLPKLEVLKMCCNLIHTINVGAFKSLPALDSLHLYSNQLQEIPYLALKNLTNLSHLELSFNKIKSFPDIGDDTMFLSLIDLAIDSNLVSVNSGYMPKISDGLQSLNLGYNNIDQITDTMWVNNKNIDTLRLGGNKVKTLQKGMFSDLSKLQNLYVNAMPELSSIGPDAFNGLSNVEVIDISHNSKLTHIDVTAFMSTNATKVFLDHNALETLQEELLPWKQMYLVLIVPNNLNCDCNLRWAAETFTSNTSLKMKQIFDELNCTAPKRLSSRKLKTLKPNDFVCETFDHSGRAATGIIVAVCCLVVMLTALILFRNRNAIASKCRRYYQYRRYKNDVIFTVDHDTSVGELDDGDLRPLKEIRLETVPL